MEHENSGLSAFVESSETVAEVFEILGVAILVIGFLAAAIMFLPALAKPAQLADAVARFKIRIGRAMMLGLEVLIAGDIIMTVAVEPTIENMAALGLLVIVRTILSWTLALEIEGRWPWQSAS